MPSGVLRIIVPLRKLVIKMSPLALIAIFSRNVPMGKLARVSAGTSNVSPPSRVGGVTSVDDALVLCWVMNYFSLSVCSTLFSLSRGRSTERLATDIERQREKGYLDMTYACPAMRLSIT